MPREELEAERARWSIWQAEQEERRLTWRPARLAVLRTGPVLRDLEAAADCMCGCHPRPAELDFHAGGVTCPCQHSPEERRAAMADLINVLDALCDDTGGDSEREGLAAHAAGLGVAATIICPAPFVMAGTADGRGFCLRERDGRYEVTVAAGEDPGADPWSLSPERVTLGIASGEGEELCGPDGRLDPTVALTVAVDAVRTFQRRCSCRHLGLRGGGAEYCASCGVRLSEAQLWRADG